MGRYIVSYLAPLSVRERFAQATPQQAMAGMKLWVDWATRLGPKLLDPGKPFGRAIRLTKSGATPADSNIVGISILDAPTMDAALALVADHHHLSWAPDCEIIVHEEIAIPELQAAGH